MEISVTGKPRSVSAIAPHLWGSRLDALLLGGASVLVFVAFRLADLSGETGAVVGVAMLVLAHFVNHPHFAHSYQLFYSGWPDVRDGHLLPEVAKRWWWAAAIAPGALAAFLAFAGWRAAQADTIWIAVAINLMGALVGWHYVKQGFGMAMTDAALKRRFWPDPVRKVLLVNAYACWAAAWIGLNSTKASAMFWGYFSLQMQLPVALLWAAWALCFCTTVWTVIVVTRAVRAMWLQQPDGPIPFNGLMAYAVSLYLWTVFSWAEPIYLLVIPFFHSLQYLTVVWRYKLNEWRVGQQAHSVRRQAVIFALSGMAMGAAGFWALPLVFDLARTGQWLTSYNEPATALACAWLFINVHHYLIDNVLWRKGNPKVSRYLFGQSPMSRPMPAAQPSPLSIR